LGGEESGVVEVVGNDRRRSLGRCILVPVANPASVRPLMQLAADLVDDNGEIRLVTVLRPDAPAEAHADAWQGMAVAELVAGQLGVTARGEVRTEPGLGDAVLDTLRERGASLVLMGWRGASSTTDVFGRLIDHIVGRSSVPLAIVRAGAQDYDRVLLPISADHLLPGGSSGLHLAADLAGRLRRGTTRPLTVLRTGRLGQDLPDEIRILSDRVHHDPRRTHQAVAAFAGATDLIVAPVAPTVSGLRAATTHLAWASPDATLLVAIDVGPTAERPLAPAFADAGRPAPGASGKGRSDIRLVVTVRLPEGGTVSPDQVERILARSGTTEHLMAWWPTDERRAHVRATVQLVAPDTDQAITRVRRAVQEAEELVGAEISYALEERPDERTSELERRGIAVFEGDLTVLRDLPDRDPSRHGGRPR
jgi:nucleotide-binding universal stress UspA family protein